MQETIHVDTGHAHYRFFPLLTNETFVIRSIVTICFNHGYTKRRYIHLLSLACNRRRFSTVCRGVGKSDEGRRSFRTTGLCLNTIFRSTYFQDLGS